MRLGSTAAMIAAGLVILTTPAHAGEVSRLQIELPPDVRAVEPGQRLDLVQVVGIDSAGERVGFGGAVPVLEASLGSVASVAPPYRFAYTAPAQIDGPTTIELTARLPGAPDVRGKLTLEVLPPGRYVRLRVESDSVSADWGGALEFQVRGETREGRLVPVADRTVDVVAEGPGSIEFVRLGHYRLVVPTTPPSDGRRDVVIRAHTAEDRAVHGKLSIALGPPVPRAGERDRADAGTPPAPPTPAGDGNADTSVPEPAAEPGSPGETATDANEQPKREAKSVLLADGLLRLTAWRARDSSAASGSGRRMRRFPAAGESFVVPEPSQRLRFIVEDESVQDVTATAVHKSRDDPDEDATAAIDVKVKRNKAGKLTVVLDARPERDGRKLRVTLRLVRGSGEPSEAVVALRRRGADDSGK